MISGFNIILIDNSEDGNKLSMKIQLLCKKKTKTEKIVVTVTFVTIIKITSQCLNKTALL